MPMPAPKPDGFQVPKRNSRVEKEVSTPFIVSKREGPSKPKSTAIPFEPDQEIPSQTSESSSQSLRDYMPSTIISKKDKKRIEKERRKQEKEEKLKIAKEKQEQLLDAMKKPKKKKKKEKKETDSFEHMKEEPLDTKPPSLFQTLSQRIDESAHEISNDTFVPFIGSEDKTKEESSTLRIIPNVADIENEPSSFKAFSPTQPEMIEPKQQKSKELLVCKQCGATLSSDYAFCNKCGSKL
jgi:ribosomal protein L40E